MTSSAPSVPSSRPLRLSAGGSLLLGAVGSASAATVITDTVVHNDAPGVTSVQSNTKGAHNFVYFDINADGTNDFLIDAANVTGSKGILGPDVNSVTPMYLSEGAALAEGSIVGPAQTFLYYSDPIDESGATSTLLSAGQSFYGFSFVDGSTNYGWIKVSYASKTVKVLGWAYDNSGAPIAVGATSPSASAVPEVSTTTLAMGSVALLAGSAAAWRRRKTRLQTAA